MAPAGQLFTKKWKFLIFWGPHLQPSAPIDVKFCTAKRTQVAVGPAKFDLNRCNESPLWGEKHDFWPVSKFNTGSLPLCGNPAGKNVDLYSASRENTANALNETQCHANRCVFKSHQNYQAQQLDHANCQADYSKLLGPSGLRSRKLVYMAGTASYAAPTRVFLAFLRSACANTKQPYANLRTLYARPTYTYATIRHSTPAYADPAIFS